MLFTGTLWHDAAGEVWTDGVGTNGLHARINAIADS